MNLFSINVNSTLFIAKIFLSCKNICFKAIQNDGKSNRVCQALTEVCHQIFGS